MFSLQQKLETKDTAEIRQTIFDAKTYAKTSRKSTWRPTPPITNQTIVGVKTSAKTIRKSTLKPTPPITNIVNSFVKKGKPYKYIIIIVRKLLVYKGRVINSSVESFSRYFYV